MADDVISEGVGSNPTVFILFHVKNVKSATANKLPEPQDKIVS